MNKASKILVTIVVIIVFIILFAIISAIRMERGNHTPGIMGLIVFAGMIGALTAIWKKK